MLLVDGVKYEIHRPSKEVEIEEAVVKHSKLIFGEKSHYFPLKKKIKSLGGIESVPDGYVLNLSKPPSWFLVEVERVKPGIWRHIVTQSSSFVGGLSESKSQDVIINALYEDISSNIVLKEEIKKEIGTSEIYQFIRNLIKKNKPEIIIIIDKKTKKVDESFERINYDKKRLIEFKIFKRVDAGIIKAFLFEPVFEELFVENNALNKKGKKNSYITIKGFRTPILKSLVEIGGKGRVKEVLDRVEINMEDKFTPEDKDRLPSGEFRWRSQAKSARYYLVEEEYLRSDSEYGFWEISEKGRNYLKKNV